jgi:hypothetical protein
LSPTSLTWSSLELNPSLHIETPASNGLRHGKVVKLARYEQPDR